MGLATLFLYRFYTAVQKFLEYKVVPDVTPRYAPYLQLPSVTYCPRYDAVYD